MGATEAFGAEEVQFTRRRAALVAVGRKAWERGDVRAGSRETKEETTATVQASDDGGWGQGGAGRVGGSNQSLHVFAT